MKLKDCNLQVNEKNFHTSSFRYFGFMFPQNITITFSKKALKVCEHNFFQEIWAESSNLPVQLQFI